MAKVLKIETYTGMTMGMEEAPQWAQITFDDGNIVHTPYPADGLWINEPIQRALDGGLAVMAHPTADPPP